MIRGAQESLCSVLSVSGKSNFGDCGGKGSSLCDCGGPGKSTLSDFDGPGTSTISDCGPRSLSLR